MRGSESMITTADPISGAPVILSTTVPIMFCVRIFCAGRLKQEKQIKTAPVINENLYFINPEMLKRMKLEVNL